MSNPNPSKVQWHEPDDNRRKATATMYEDGTLRFGVEMCGKLHKRIRIGFIPNECTLVVEINMEKGFQLPKTGETRMGDVTMHLRRLGVELPICFLFDEEIKDTYWKGYIIPMARKVKSRMPKKSILTAEHQSLMNAYKWLIDRAVFNYAKSTPSDERREIATEAFWEALIGYSPIYGNLKEYLFEKIKSRLIEQNKQYSKINRFNCISLDSSPSKDDTACESNYNWLLASFKNEIAAAEDRADMAIFKKLYLNKREVKILDMLMSGYTVVEIIHECDILQPEIEELCESIGERWNDFNHFNGDPAA